MPLPRDYISYNQIRVYLSCPKQYYYSYIEEIKTPINDKVLLGIIFHSSVDFYLKRKISGDLPDFKETEEFFISRFNSFVSSTDIIWKEIKDKVLKRGLAMIRHFISYIAPKLNPIMTEKELVTEIPGSNIKIKGVIDLIEDDFSITDFKTTTSKWSKKRVDNALLQLYIYKYLFEMNMKGTSINQLKFSILFSKNESNVRHQEFVINSRDADFTKMHSIIDHVAEGIEKGLFFKNEGYICNMCNYKDICRKSSLKV